MDGASPTTAWLEVFGNGNNEGRDAGHWECSPRKYHLERASEEMWYIPQSHWKQIRDEGNEYEVNAGDVLYLCRGWRVPAM